MNNKYLKPDKISILGIEYRIEYVDNVTNVDIDGKKDELWGQLSTLHKKIRIYDNGDMKQIWTTIIHEVLHGIADTLSFKIPEYQIASFGVGLGDIFYKIAEAYLKTIEDCRNKNEKI